MKASEFKNLIKEAVKEAIREELMGTTQQPEQPVVESRPAPEPVKFKGSDPISEALNMTSKSMITSEYRSAVNVDSTMAKYFDKSVFMPKSNATPGTPAAINSAPKVGIDLSALSFVKTANAVLKASNEKDKMRNGL